MSRAQKGTDRNTRRAKHQLLVDKAVPQVTAEKGKHGEATRVVVYVHYSADSISRLKQQRSMSKSGIRPLLIMYVMMHEYTC